jgi:hypothetical protein
VHTPQRIKADFFPGHTFISMLVLSCEESEAMDK